MGSNVESSSSYEQELRVTFYPELYLQRRVWILNFLRKENITRVRVVYPICFNSSLSRSVLIQILDVGCGEGELIRALCQPAPWLTPPPPSVLPPLSAPEESSPQSPAYNDDEIPNLHMTEVHGLDISSADLVFALEAAAPPELKVDEAGSPGFRSYAVSMQRWESLTSKIWRGGLEAVNEEFVDIECIVSMEV